ncbi:MAG: biotin synthase, partial [Methylococcales bacterium]|nr:biotin synthase [Methylococcales bacterium]
MSAALTIQPTILRHDWSLDEIQSLFSLSFNDLLFKAQSLHRQHFDPNQVQISSLLSIKTGSCSEDCGYCPQSARYDSDLKPEALMPINEVLDAAKKAQAEGASRFCMG